MTVIGLPERGVERLTGHVVQMRVVDADRHVAVLQREQFVGQLDDGAAGRDARECVELPADKISAVEGDAREKRGLAFGIAKRSQRVCTRLEPHSDTISATSPRSSSAALMRPASPGSA